MTIGFKQQEYIGREKLGPVSVQIPAINRVVEECIKCGRCAEECTFLQKNGLPGQIAKEHVSKGTTCFDTAFSCSLCGLCSHFCPKRLPVAEMFLAIRRDAVASGRGRYKEHRRILGYELLGSTPPFSGYLIPENCTTVFFPGCTLPGIRPEQTLKLFLLLQSHIPELGIIFDCCNKPSHDLGLEARFLKSFQPKLERLHAMGIQKVVTACPSCFVLFRQYGEKLEVSTAFTEIAGSIQQDDTACTRQYCVHDACTTRFDPEVHQAVRVIARSRGIQITEMPHSREATLCCGEGGSAGCVPHGSAPDWSGQRLAEANGLPLVTYCAGCTTKLGSENASHIVDLLFEPRNTAFAPLKVPGFFAACLNRMALKRKIAKCIL